jgi:hypothetical protein
MIGAWLMLLGLGCMAEPRRPLGANPGDGGTRGIPRIIPLSGIPNRDDPYHMPRLHLHAVDPEMVVRPNPEIDYKLLILNPYTRIFNSGQMGRGPGKR